LNTNIIQKKHFRVAIFGSARSKKGDSNWNLIYDLAKRIAQESMDIVTGGGPGLMDAASEGHYSGDSSEEAHSIGLQIRLPKEQRTAHHLDIKKEFSRFSSRLDNFMELANVVVVAPGGIGTILELFYTWQLMQVKMICNIPIILLGEMWIDLVRWIKEWPLKNQLLDKNDVELLYLVDNCEDALVIIRKAYEEFTKGDEKFCLNYDKYKELK
jgi:uncharacterized protein (TIGR00730 family)